MRPSSTATTDAFGAVVNSSKSSDFGDAVGPDVLAAAAAVGDGAAVEPGVLALEALLGIALAPAVALEVEEAAPTGVLHTSRLPVTGRRASISPVKVEITVLG